MLRELAWLVMPKLECHFCHKALIPEVNASVTFGHRRHTTISNKFSVHHFNKDRTDNHRGEPVVSGSTGLVWFNGNLRLAHKLCHIQFHANERRQGEPERDDDTE
jgi:hypothetical protein